MFPWLTGRGRQDDPIHVSDTDMASNNNEDDDDYMMMDMDMGTTIDFTQRYKAFSSDQLPESNLQSQLEFGGKCTHCYQLIHCSVDASVGLGETVSL